jgi:hypothetical protein
MRRSIRNYWANKTGLRPPSIFEIRCREPTRLYIRDTGLNSCTEEKKVIPAGADGFDEIGTTDNIREYD